MKVGAASTVGGGGASTVIAAARQGAGEPGGLPHRVRVLRVIACLLGQLHRTVIGGGGMTVPPAVRATQAVRGMRFVIIGSSLGLPQHGCQNICLTPLLQPSPSLSSGQQAYLSPAIKQRVPISGLHKNRWYTMTVPMQPSHNYVSNPLQTCKTEQASLQQGPTAA